MKRLFVALLLLALTVGGTTIYLKSSGYFEDPAAAGRILKKRGATADPSTLFQAVDNDDAALIKLLCRAGLSPDQRDASANTPLHHAVAKQHWVAAHALLDRGVVLNARNSANECPLELVLRSKNLTFAARMLTLGANPNFIDASGQPALIEAIRSNQMATVRLLLAHGANPNQQNSAGTTPLYLAIRSGQPALVSNLLAAGASANSTTPANQPLLHFMCQHREACGYTEESGVAVLLELIEKGADPDRVDASGKIPLRHALDVGYDDAVAALLDRTKDVSDLLWPALEKENHGLLNALVQKGADVNRRRGDGETPLNHAVRATRPDLVHLLMEHGADPSLPGKEGQAAVPLSIVLGDERTTLTIIGHERAPPPDQVLGHPVSPEFLKLFSSALLDFYLRNAQDITPLMCAVCLDQEAVAIKLIDSGARRFAATSPKKVLPVQLAARRKNVRMQQILIGVPHQDEEQERLFIINLAKQEVTFMKSGAKPMIAKISSGRESHPTEPGKYVITDKAKMHHSNIYDEAEMPFFQRFSCSPVGFHQGSLPGYPASHGCVRLDEKTAKFFFEQSKVGDRVLIVEN